MQVRYLPMPSRDSDGIERLSRRHFSEILNPLSRIWQAVTRTLHKGPSAAMPKFGCIASVFSVSSIEIRASLTSDCRIRVPDYSQIARCHASSLNTSYGRIEERSCGRFVCVAATCRRLTGVGRVLRNACQRVAFFQCRQSLRRCRFISASPSGRGFLRFSLGRHRSVRAMLST